jgi:acyl-CoA synthetase (NDP forming)
MRLVERQRYLHDVRAPLPEFSVKSKKVAEILATAQKNKVHTLSTLQSLMCFDAYGLPIPKFGSAASLADAKKLANEMGYPVVLKISSMTVSHKSDIGGVITNIKNDAELTQKWKMLLDNLTKANLLKSLDGVVVMQQVKGSSREMVAGIVKKDNLHQMMFGLGGIFVEAFKEIAFRPCPLTVKDAHDLLYATKAASLMGALRGQKAADPLKMQAILLRLSKLVTDFPEILELDANPIMLAENGAIHVVDARISI